MSIRDYDFIEAPYVDDMFDYDYDLSMYIPLVDGIKEYGSISLLKDWTTEENAQAYLQLVASVMYTSIIEKKNVKYRYHIMYYLSHSKQARQELQRLFLDEAWYNRRDGGFMMAYNTGANLNQGKLIEFGIDKAVSSIAKQILANSWLGTRAFEMDLNTRVVKTSLEDMMTYLVSEGYINQDEADVVSESEDLNDLPYTEDYSVVKVNNNKYLFIDYKSIEKFKQDMKIFNENGTW